MAGPYRSSVNTPKISKLDTFMSQAKAGDERSDLTKDTAGLADTQAQTAQQRTQVANTVTAKKDDLQAKTSGFKLAVAPMKTVTPKPIVAPNANQLDSTARTAGWDGTTTDDDYWQYAQTPEDIDALKKADFDNYSGQQRALVDYFGEQQKLIAEGKLARHTSLAEYLKDPNAAIDAQNKLAGRAGYGQIGALSGIEQDSAGLNAALAGSRTGNDQGILAGLFGGYNVGENSALDSQVYGGDLANMRERADSIRGQDLMSKRQGTTALTEFLGGIKGAESRRNTFQTGKEKEIHDLNVTENANELKNFNTQTDNISTAAGKLDNKYNIDKAWNSDEFMRSATTSIDKIQLPSGGSTGSASNDIFQAHTSGQSTLDGVASYGPSDVEQAQSSITLIESMIARAEKTFGKDSKEHKAVLAKAGPKLRDLTTIVRQTSVAPSDVLPDGGRPVGGSIGGGQGASQGTSRSTPNGLRKIGTGGS